MEQSFSLMIHGGAGEMDQLRDEQDAAPYRDGIRGILERGREILRQGGAALDAVESCTALLEDEPLFNAGRGSTLNERGQVEMDAAIMDGRDLGAGSVAGVTRLANPVRLARRILGAGEHVMLAGSGAMRFAAEQGMARVPEDYLITDHRLRQYETACAAHGTEAKPAHGTVGAVARDQAGDLAAATSTGGLVCKRQGRIGDSPVIGAGVYADNHTCAASATGRGEDFLRTVLAKHISDLIHYQQVDAAGAARQAIAYLGQRINGRGGVIVVDRDGRCAGCFNSRTMIHGWIEHGGPTTVIWQ